MPGPTILATSGGYVAGVRTQLSFAPLVVEERIEPRLLPGAR